MASLKLAVAVAACLAVTMILLNGVAGQEPSLSEKCSKCKEESQAQCESIIPTTNCADACGNGVAADCDKCKAEEVPKCAAGMYAGKCGQMMGCPGLEA